MIGNSATYDKEYYQNDCGPVPYDNTEIWMTHFGETADRIIAAFHPKTVLDVGCAYGYLVACLRDRGVEAYGVDNSDFALSRVREDIRPYCFKSDALTDLPTSIPEKFDVLTNIEMIEHLKEEGAAPLIHRMCGLSDVIIFSSTPDDYSTASHYNVQKQEYWAKRFARENFIRVLDCPRMEVSAQEMVFRKNGSEIPSIVEDYEHYIRLLNLRKEQELKAVIESKDNAIAAQNEVIRIKDDYISGKQRECDSLNERLSAAQRNQEELSTNLSQIGRLEDELQAKRDMIDELEVALNDNTAAIAAVREEKETWIRIACERLDIINNFRNEIANGQEQVKQYQAGMDEMNRLYTGTINSVYWKVTYPVRWLVFVAKLFLKKAPVSRRIWPYLRVWRRQGFRAMQEFRREVKNGTAVALVFDAPPAAVVEAPAVQPVAAQPVIAQPIAAQPVAAEPQRTVVPITGHPIDPISVVYTGEKVKRLNLVTDSIASGSLLGGTSTALVCATKLAKEYGYELRIITRKEDILPTKYWDNIRINGIEAPDKVSFFSDYARYLPDSAPYKMEMGTDEVFFATSWWSVAAIKATAPNCKIIYIIQEVESFFYNYGSEHLICSQIMEDPNITFIVNSHYLNDYFKESVPNIVEHGCWFEPAFCSELYRCGDFAKKEKYKLFFYARPNNPRNLFPIGAKYLSRAVEEGILDTDKWTVYCVGQAAPVLTFSNGESSVNLGQLSWEEYAEFLADVDLGLCLMYTPHPSYPPYDLACSGGVVLSNKMMNKQTFDACRNVIMADLDEDKFMEYFREAVALAEDNEQRKRNYEENTINRDWNTALQPVVDYMKEVLG